MESMKTTVTKENQKGVRYFFHKKLTYKGTANPICVRRNGKTQVWKTRPTEFKIPIKYGLYEFGYITHENCNEWTID